MNVELASLCQLQQNLVHGGINELHYLMKNIYHQFFL